MNIILFSVYFFKLRLSVLVGFYQTAHPLNLTWRWQHWHNHYHLQKRSDF